MKNDLKWWLRQSSITEPPPEWVLEESVEYIEALEAENERLRRDRDILTTQLSKIEGDDEW